ncbi:MAG: alanine racemase, partial [Parcubacteria group bacterium]|nr:alanine racemase [Parcubacteria group bacterium]
TGVEIDTRALKNNARALKRFLGKKTLLMGVVKSNAYGHGLVPVARALESADIDWLAVDSVVEALRLRRDGIRAPILVLGYTLPEHFVKASKEKISLTVSSFAAFAAARRWTEKNKKPLGIHLKIDTGMHRQGFLPEEIFALKKILQKNHSNVLKNLRIVATRKKHADNLKIVGMSVEGVYSHFASANPKDPASANAQMETFKKAMRELREIVPVPLAHIVASGGALMFPREFPMARSGIMLYGLWPSQSTRICGEKKLKLTPVLSWRTIIGEIKQIPRGEKIGYDLTEMLSRTSIIGICPIGYWHGYPRSLSGKGELLVRGKRAKVLGRVSMDMIAIDVTDIPNITMGDVATIIGKDCDERMGVEEVALNADTTHYEILTRINPLIKRIFL